MVRKRVYIEGGGNSKQMKIECRRGFRELFQKCELPGRLPHLVACGSRNDTFKDFETAHENASTSDFTAMLIDSEDRVRDINKAWEHLKERDNWERPDGADDEQVLLMVTCMETWIATDREALKEHYGQHLQESALPPVSNMESRDRHDILSQLERATRNCKNSYAKGRDSFDVLARLNPDVLRKNLPSFTRCLSILQKRLK